MNKFLNGLARVIIPIFILGFILLIYSWTVYLDWRAESTRRDKLIGSYSLDIQRTKLGIYKADSMKYGKLVLNLNDDMTFDFSASVPFILDSVGKWNAGGDGEAEWNYMYYERWGYKNYKKGSGDQFTDCCDEDTTFQINSVTPKSGETAVNIVVFKKLNPKEADFE